MIVAERRVKIIVSNIVADFSHHVFNPSDCPDMNKAFFDAKSELNGIEKVFSEGKMLRFIKRYQEELLQLAQLSVGVTVSNSNKCEEITDVEVQS